MGRWDVSFTARELLPECEEDDLRAYFSEFGRVSDVQLARDKQTRLSLRFARIAMADKTSIEQILAKPHQLWEHEVAVSNKPLESAEEEALKPMAPAPRPVASRNVSVPVAAKKAEENMFFFSGLGPDTTEDDLSAHFAQFAEVKRVEIQKDHTGASRGKGHIVMTDAVGDEELLKHTHEIGGTPFTVKRHTEKPPPPARGSAGAASYPPAPGATDRRGAYGGTDRGGGGHSGGERGGSYGGAERGGSYGGAGRGGSYGGGERGTSNATGGSPYGGAKGESAKGSPYGAAERGGSPYGHADYGGSHGSKGKAPLVPAPGKGARDQPSASYGGKGGGESYGGKGGGERGAASYGSTPPSYGLSGRDSARAPSAAPSTSIGGWGGGSGGGAAEDKAASVGGWGRNTSAGGGGGAPRSSWGSQMAAGAIGGHDGGYGKASGGKGGSQPY